MIAQELDLFRYRFLSLSSDKVQQFLDSENLLYLPVRCLVNTLSLLYLPLYFTYLSRSPHGRICTKFVVATEVADVITFLDDQLKGVDSVRGGRSLPFFGQGQSLLTQGWHYCAARDIF